MKLWAFLALVPAAVLGGLGASAASSSPPASVGAIVFSSNPGGTTNLYVVGSNGSGRRRLTSGPGFDLAPKWSPGRRQVAFTSLRQSGTATQADVYVVGSDGRGLRALVETQRDETEASWSPDGRSIVLSRDSTGRGGYDLYVVTVATGALRRLTATRAGESAPAWSPSGRWIAYARGGAIWLIRPDGTRAHSLRRAGSGVDWAPDWSPDSRRILFESMSLTGAKDPISLVWVMNADGTGKRRLTPYNPRRRAAATSPAWSPGGAQIVFSRADQLWTMRPDGSRVRQLTRGPADAWSPDW